jgi:hypothetical protein
MKKRSLKMGKDVQKEIDKARSASARYGNFLAL